MPPQKRPPPKRVSNSLGCLFGGGARRRLILLVDRKKFVELAQADVLVSAISEQARDVVLGVARIRKEDDGYHADIIEGDIEGYYHILRQLASAVGDGDGVSHIVWGDRMAATRSWGPYQGLRRRGAQARAKFQRETRYSNERMNQTVEFLWRAFCLASGAENDPEPEGTLD